MERGPIDDALVTEGREASEIDGASGHELDECLVGAAILGVTGRRPPA